MKRVTIICGHYGSGKTNIAVNLACSMADAGIPTTIADLDIVNPYFRTVDSKEELESRNIRVVCSEYANSNVDIPSLPGDLYTITDDRSRHVVLDIGGDDRGAFVLGRLAPKIREEDDYDLWCVINQYRPLTGDVESTLEILREIQEAAGLQFTGIINNSNLGEETTPEDVLSSMDYARETAQAAGLPLICTTCKADLKLNEEQLEQLKPALQINLQKKIV